MDDEELPNFSIDFDFLSNEYFCEDVPDDILILLEVTLCDKIAAVNKENRKKKNTVGLSPRIVTRRADLTKHQRS